MLFKHQAIACPAFRACERELDARLAFIGALASLLALPAPAQAQARDTAACLDANERSITLENDGKQLAARENLRECAALECPTEIREECERRLTEINQVIPSVLFEFGDEQGKPISPVQIRLDGELQPAQAATALIEANPGQHVFVFEAPGYAPIRSELVLSARQLRRPERITFSAATPAATESAPSNQQGLHGQRLTALILGGTSVVAAGFGTAFGLMAIHKDGEVDKACDAQRCENPADTQKSRTAVTQGNLSTAFFAVSAAAAAGGLVLWFTSPEDQPKEKNLQLGVGFGALRLRGTF